MAKRSASFVDRILKGTASGDLPAEQATEFKLFVNLKTAKELGITIPATIFARADEVIDQAFLWADFAAPAQVCSWHTPSVPDLGNVGPAPSPDPSRVCALINERSPLCKGDGKVPMHGGPRTKSLRCRGRGWVPPTLTI
jgi:hypothetical protein